MSLEQTTNEQIKEAMKAKDQDRLRTLRAIKAAILVEKSSDGRDALDETTEQKILQKMAKQRRESIGIYEEQNRPELAASEKNELAIIETFLPEQMSEADLRNALSTLISEVGAEGPKDMGKVMGQASKKFAGVADGKLMSGIVRELLN